MVFLVSGKSMTRKTVIKLRLWLNLALARLGIRLYLPPWIEPNPQALWLKDREFEAMMTLIRGRTLLDRQRCYMLYQLARIQREKGGDWAEVGVYKGGSARLLSKLMGKGQRLLLFDTFSGMPQTRKGVDFHHEGDFSDTTIKAVRKFLGKNRKIELIPGQFPKSASGLTRQRFSLVHIDVDIYKSVFDCCRFFYPRMVKGGIMIFDDYGFLSCPGAKMAVDEFFKEREATPIYLPTGQALVIVN